MVDKIFMAFLIGDPGSKQTDGSCTYIRVKLIFLGLNCPGKSELCSDTLNRLVVFSECYTLLVTHQTAVLSKLLLQPVRGAAAVTGGGTQTGSGNA